MATNFWELEHPQHKMLSRLGEIALQRGLTKVQLKLIPSKKNQPARDFLETIGGQFRQLLEEEFLYDLPASRATQAHLLQVEHRIESAVVRPEPNATVANPRIEGIGFQEPAKCPGTAMVLRHRWYLDRWQMSDSLSFRTTQPPPIGDLINGWEKAEGPR